MVTEAWEEKQKARRVLGAAVAEAEGKPDQHVFALPVMRRAGVTNAEFRAAARYLDEQGWIAEGRRRERRGPRDGKARAQLKDRRRTR
jgi:hypothetical protein